VAAKTYWVRAIGGDDGNGGESFADGFATIAAGLQALVSNASKGSILNIANDGDHTPAATAVNITNGAGTSYTDFGYLIRGRTMLDTPAMANIVTGTGAFVSIVQFRSGSGYNIVEGLNIDATAAQLDSTYMHRYITINQNSAAPGPNWVRYCVLTGGTTEAPDQSRILYGWVTNSANNFGRVSHCVFNNASRQYGVIAGSGSFTYGEMLEVDHCVFCKTGENAVYSISLSAAVSALSVVNIHHNTAYHAWTGTGLGASAGLASASGKSNTSSDMGSFSLHSNIYFSSHDTDISISPLITDSVAGTRVISAGTIGYNVLYSSMPIESLSAAGWYSATYSINGNPSGTDRVAHNSTAATLFYAPTSSYTWDFNGSSYSTTLPADLRPKYGFRTAGFAGTIPGAIDTTYDVAPTATASSHACITGDTVSSAVTMTDSDSLPGPLTAELVSYTGPGTLTLNSDGTFTYTAYSYFDGTDTFTFRAFDGELYSDPAIVSIVVTAPPIVSGGEDPDDPVSDSAYVDVLPWFEPDLQCNAVLSVQTKRNRTIHHDSRSYAQTQRWREALHRVITLGTSTTQQVTFGGIQTARSLFLETSAPIDVAVDETSAYWPVSDMVALMLSQINNLYIRNNSTTSTATVILAAVD
jgi:hypothetical protein